MAFRRLVVNPRFLFLAAGVFAAAVITVVVVITREETQPPTSYLISLAQQSGLEEPVLVSDYVPVHPKDDPNRTCYRVRPEPATGRMECLAERDEHGPGLGWGGCVGDSELDDDLAWCDRDLLAEEFEIRYDHDPREFPEGWDEKARSNGLYGSQPVDVPGAGDWCFRFGPDDGMGVMCWYERIDPWLFGRPLSSPCGRGYAGSFWCMTGEHRVTDLPPYDAETWTWSWMDPR